MAARNIQVEVCYALPDTQKIVNVEVPTGSSIKFAIATSKIQDIFPEINLETNKVGVFGLQKQMTDEVKDGDRIEIYRPLFLDPKEARRRRQVSSR